MFLTIYFLTLRVAWFALPLTFRTTAPFCSLFPRCNDDVCIISAHRACAQVQVCHTNTQPVITFPHAFVFTAMCFHECVLYAWRTQTPPIAQMLASQVRHFTYRKWFLDSKRTQSAHGAFVCHLFISKCSRYSFLPITLCVWLRRRMFQRSCCTSLLCAAACKHIEFESSSSEWDGFFGVVLGCKTFPGHVFTVGGFRVVLRNTRGGRCWAKYEDDARQPRRVYVAKLIAADFGIAFLVYNVSRRLEC